MALVLAAFFVLAPVWPAGAQSGARAVERAARDAQRRFEILRRARLPLTAPHSGPCEVSIGRFCYWNDSADPPLPPEPADVSAARDRVRDTLAALAAAAPRNDFIAGQRVRYALESGDTAGAVAELAHCAATPWWCDALRGLALHRAGDERRAAASFDSALAAMPDTLRCAWMDVREWLPSDAHLLGKRSSCAERERVAARLFWLGAPLLTWRPAALRDEFLTRRTEARLFAGTALPDAYGWGDDNALLSLRFGRPNHWAREDIIAGALPAPIELPVIGLEPRPAIAFVPRRHALEHPLEADPEDWDTRDVVAPPMRYAPPWLRSVTPLMVQIARFRRGDSAEVVAAYDARDAIAHDTASRDTSALRAAAVIMSVPDSVLAAGDAASSSAHAAITLRAPARDALLAVEVLDSAGRRAFRWRGAVPPLHADAAVSDLLVGVASSGTSVATTPIGLDSAAALASGTLRAVPGDTLLLYWESYGQATPAAPARVSVRLTPLRAGLGTRVMRALHLAHAAAPVALAWTDAGRVDGDVSRTLRLGIPDLAPGRYRLELSVAGDLVKGLAEREITVVPRRDDH